MPHVFLAAHLEPLRKKLDEHPVYAAVKTIDHLRQFMAQHIYSVWDFMSLLKYLQQRLASPSVPWAPGGNPMVRRFINDIVLEEETDLALPDSSGNPTYLSHFELYAQSLEEVGGSAEAALSFASSAADNGFFETLHAAGDNVPASSRAFMTQTFQFIATDKPHIVAAAFALGREKIIPPMFRALLENMAIDEKQAPAFHYYLKRHIHLDEDHHGPLSMLMLEELCGGDPHLIKEAETAAEMAIKARLAFWDAVLEGFAP